MRKSFYLLAAVLFMAACGQQKQQEQAADILPAENFDTTINNIPVKLYTLKAGDIVLQATNFGGRVVTIFTPDKNGKKENIVTFSFEEGGFVCGNCFHEDMERDLNKNQMLLLRAAFNTNDPENVDFPYEKEDALVVLNKFYEFIIDSFGVRLKSFALIR